MGLDMYLSARRYTSKYSDGPIYASLSARAEQYGLPADCESFTVSAQVAYWRKANQIHNWFVTNCQDGNDDCREAHVNREQLTDLRDMCQKAIDTQDGTVLPPVEGFFFGGTEINDFYWDDLHDTVTQLDKVLAMPDTLEFSYQASW